MTELAYMNAPQETEIEATVERVEELDGQLALILDRTPIYPQGGGQPSDTGTIEGDGFVFAIRKAVLVDGEVFHTGDVLEGGPAPGPVEVRVDGSRRARNAALHSGGHLVMTSMFELTGRRAVKGYHFPDGPYVEVEGALTENEKEEVASALQRRVDAMVAADEAIAVESIPADELTARGIYAPVPPPQGKPCRVVTTCGYRSPCGGTHVSSTGELAGLRIRRIKSKKGRTRIAYGIEEGS